jgi:hypothetical protein
MNLPVWSVTLFQFYTIIISSKKTKKNSNFPKVTNIQCSIFLLPTDQFHLSSKRVMTLPRNVGAYSFSKEIGEIKQAKVCLVIALAAIINSLFLWSQLYESKHVFSERNVLLLAVELVGFERDSVGRNRLDGILKAIRNARNECYVSVKETFVRILLL